MKKFSLLLAMLMLASLMLTACGQSASSSAASESQPAASTSESASAEPEEEDEENYETGDAALDNPRNQDEIGEKELLVVSFGTSFNDSRRLTIGAIENDLETAFPDYSVRRGFTANIVIDHVNRRDGEKIDDIGESLDRAAANGVKNLVVQPRSRIIPTHSRRLLSATRCSPPTRISRPLRTLSLTGQRTTTTARPLSYSWVTAPRLSLTRFTRRCRIC